MENTKKITQERRITETAEAKKWNFVVAFTVLTLLFGFNQYLDYLLVAAMAAVILALNPKQLLYAYVYLYFFEEVLSFPNLYGITIVILSPLIAVKLLYILIKRKIVPKTRELLIFGFFLFSSAIALISGNFGKATLVVDMTVAIVLMFSMVIRQYRNKDEIVKELFLTIIIAVTNAVVYGLAHNNFMDEVRSDAVIWRFNGTYEPNYMAMFLNLSLFSLIRLRSYFGIPLSIAIFIVNFAALAYTKSTTGLICFLFVLMLKVIKNAGVIRSLIRKQLTGSDKVNAALDITITVLMMVMTVIVICIIEMKYHIISEKLLLIVNRIRTGNISSATSGRLPIIKKFYQEFRAKPLINILFGNAPQSLKVYSKYFGDYKYAHNMYVDLFYCFGLVGGTISLGFILRQTFCHRFLSETLEQQSKSLIFFERLILLLSAIGLSMHCEVLTLVLFLL